jgi:hypothetical protein
MSLSRRKFLGVLAVLPFAGGMAARALAAEQQPDALNLDELLKVCYEVKRNRESIQWTDGTWEGRNRCVNLAIEHAKRTGNGLVLFVDTERMHPLWHRVAALDAGCVGAPISEPKRDALYSPYRWISVSGNRYSMLKGTTANPDAFRGMEPSFVVVDGAYDEALHAAIAPQMGRRKTS